MGFVIQRADGTTDGLGDRVVFDTEAEAWEAAQNAFRRDPASDGPDGVRAWLQVVAVDDDEEDEADAQREAESRAKLLSSRLRGGARAYAFRLAGSWYVVTRGTGEGYDYAYDPDAIDRADLLRPDWDYSAWCASARPEEEIDVVVAYYMAEERELGARGGGAILNDDQRELLMLARKYA